LPSPLLLSRLSLLLACRRLELGQPFLHLGHGFFVFALLGEGESLLTQLCAAELTKQCQEAVKQDPNSSGAKLCQEGLTLHQQGKDKEAMAKMQEGLAQLQPAKAPAAKPY
jgi:hypothetical protein